MKNLEASSITKVTVYEKEKGMMAETEEIVMKEGTQLSFTLFYYLEMS